MTDLLKDTLTERAGSTEPPGLDLDAIISTGDRRIRRRRTVAVVGTAMVTLAVLVTGLTLTKPSDDQPAPVATPFTERRATYAIGSEIHFGSDVISIAPRKINAFVQTDTGFVFTAVGETGLFVADGKQVRRIATYPGELTTLTAGSRGNLVGWVETSPSVDRSDSVIYDVAANRELLRTPLGNKRGPLFDPVMGPSVIAIDGGYAYFGTFDGVYRWELSTGKYQLIVKALPDGIRTVSSSQYLFQRPLEHPTGGTSLAFGVKPGDHTGRDFPGQQGYLSPTAKYLLTATNDPQKISPPPADLKLFLTATGESLPLRHPDHPRLIFNQWLTDDTFTAVGLRTASGSGSGSPVDLLTCSTKSLSCQTTVSAFSTLTFAKGPPRTAPFALPIGTPIYWLFS